ncbi:MAG: hypothetical protein ACPHQ9_12975 [Marinobacter sp.]|uniref:hypothetical protein n=1 Tax=Marinobacter sp. TaxID=50741 RepID=UPI003C44BD94
MSNNEPRAASHYRNGFSNPAGRISELEHLLEFAQKEIDELRARADACQQEAKIWKQEARTQSAIVAEIYQELTGKTGEPGDWNGARPLKPAILRKQAEAVEAFGARVAEGAIEDENFEDGDFAAGDVQTMADSEGRRLRQQAGDLEKSGGGDA